MNIYQTVSEQASFSFSVAPPWYRTIWAFIGYVLVLILAIFAAIRISSAQLRAKNVRLERIVQERTAEIEKKNAALEQQNDEILHQKKEIEDSINYARRIQEAILPINMDIANAYPESFVLFRPKDIVSGDFYWFGATETHTILVCADCTGHGVPGALMSMIGSDKLNQAVLQNGLTNPADILSFVNRGIKNSLKQDEDKDTTRDGMDAAIMSFSKDLSTVQYAGANRALWMVRDGELMEYAPTKSAVGGFTPDDQAYVVHDIAPMAGDRFYMTTDGYADQFGGMGGKKLKVKTLKDFIMELHQQPMATQSEILEQRFNEWRGDLEQIDDVCVIGVRL
jgi:serine phosphatase RsbU (regulator of sigma subunit)